MNWASKETTLKSDSIKQKRTKLTMHGFLEFLWINLKKNQLTSRSASNNMLLGSSSNRSNNQNTNTNFYERIKK